jgi:hypothetical protein
MWKWYKTSSPRNGFAVVAGGAALLRGVSKDEAIEVENAPATGGIADHGLFRAAS